MHLNTVTVIFLNKESNEKLIEKYIAKLLKMLRYCMSKSLDLFYIVNYYTNESRLLQHTA